MEKTTGENFRFQTRDPVRDWLGEDPAIAEERITETLETEMLVIGGGLGGLVCAASGAELGVKTLLIEKQSAFAGTKNEFGALDSRLQKEAGVEIDKDELIRDARMYSANYIDERLWRLWADESGEAIDWLTDRFNEGGSRMQLQGGYEQHPSDGHGFTKYICGHRPVWGKKTGARILSDYAQSHGALMMMKTGLVDLIREDGRISGCVARTSGGDLIRINASKGVVVATGGYANNLPMIEALQPHTRDMICLTVCDGHGMGDGIRACIRAGAKFEDVHTSIVFDRGVLRAAETPRECALDGGTNELNAQPWLKVNLHGERFANESAPYDYFLHAASLQPGNCFCVVFDSKYEADVERFGMAGCSRLTPFPNGAPPGHTLQEMTAKLERQAAEGRYIKADSIEELARGLSIPETTLILTIARYNELCRTGKDEDFGKLPHHLSTVTEPPFFGCRTCGFLLATVDGIRIDTDMRALDEKLEPIPGLYVAGNDSGGFFAISYFNYITGCAAGRTVTFARRAAKRIAKTYPCNGSASTV